MTSRNSKHEFLTELYYLSNIKFLHLVVPKEVGYSDLVIERVKSWPLRRAIFSDHTIIIQTGHRLSSIHKRGLHAKFGSIGIISYPLNGVSLSFCSTSQHARFFSSLLSYKKKHAPLGLAFNSCQIRKFIEYERLELRKQP